MTLDIILRTHDSGEIHVQEESRYCSESKQEVVIRCVKSLISSAKQLSIDYKFIWIDDHSTQETISIIQDLFKDCNVLYVPMEECGWIPSGLRQYEFARDSQADLVYLVEDDYLHFPTALSEMVDAYLQFSMNLGTEVCVHPFDDPDNYKPKWIEPTRIVYGKNRHWRTNRYTTFTFMCSPIVIKTYWSIFYTMTTEYGTYWGESNNIHEGTTVNKIWREHIPLFTPIPSVALHMGYLEQKDPYIDWKSLWDKQNII